METQLIDMIRASDLATVLLVIGGLVQKEREFQISIGTSGPTIRHLDDSKDYIERAADWSRMVAL